MYRIEDQTSAIKELQRLLGIAQTGYYNAKTRELVMATQESEKMPVTGIADYRTFSAIVKKHRMNAQQTWSNNYLFSPSFPYKEGDMDENVQKINKGIAAVAQGYSYEGTVPNGKYYGYHTVMASNYLRKVFGMEASDVVDESFMNRLIAELDALEIKRKTCI